MISVIVAASENNVIGKDKKLPWHMPSDLKFFKSKTENHVMVMGRKTFESLGKPLKNRVHIVVTRQADFKADGVIVVSSLKDALRKAQEFGDKEIFIIGGGEIFDQCMDIVDRIYLTRIHHEFEGDTFFPELSEEKWKITCEERHSADEKNPYDFSFLTFDRIN